MADFTVGSTGFVNYFPSTERTERNVKEAFQKYGENIAIIDGDDDWNASALFHPSTLCEKWHIPLLGYFHSGISGISKSGVVISKNDLENFIKFFNKRKYEILKNSRHKGLSEESIRIFNGEKKCWETLFEVRFDSVQKRVFIKVNNFKVIKSEKSVAF